MFDTGFWRKKKLLTFAVMSISLSVFGIKCYIIWNKNVIGDWGVKKSPHSRGQLEILQAPSHHEETSVFFSDSEAKWNKPPLP